ncbi:MAG: isopenicillin-N epimerase [Phycisphaerales bacterium]|nr:MAG: isopenicillin-N epimerase [Phycisphaerales bacterium]
MGQRYPAMPGPSPAFSSADGPGPACQAADADASNTPAPHDNPHGDPHGDPLDDPLDDRGRPGLPEPSPCARHWLHHPQVVFLNHGSFGGCPSWVLETQNAWRARMEGEPVRFFVQDLFDLLDWARQDVADFLGCDAQGLVFVPNATTGVATALHALVGHLRTTGQARPGDQLLVTSHEYPACLHNARAVARAAGLELVTAHLPMPDPTPQGVMDAVLSAVGPRTRVALLSQVTSASAMVLPIADLVAALESRGVRVVVDGAHGPGHVPTSVASLGASFYAANLHKWVCSPKGSAVLWVRPDHREHCRPLVLSNLAEAPPPGRPRLHSEFDYVGTADPTPWLCVPAALRVMAQIATGLPPRRYPAQAFDTRHDRPWLAWAWATIRSSNRRLALQARSMLSQTLGTPPPVPDSMTGCIALVGLPKPPAGRQPGHGDDARQAGPYADALQQVLVERWSVQVPVVHPPTPLGAPLRYVRLSAQLYNSPAQYAYLARVLPQALADESAGGGPTAQPGGAS